MPSRPMTWLLIAAATALPAAPIRAQVAVIDVPAIAQLVQQVQFLRQQVETAEQQLLQARSTLQSMTGGRAMDSLLRGTPRNYLPTSWPQLAAARSGGTSAFPELSAAAQSAMAANSILTPQQLATLSAAGQREILAGRQTSALAQALAQTALANASGRFSALQTLIDAIPAASDQKGILDLQARIGAEIGMLQNEGTKLQILYRALQAQESLDRQRVREAVIAGHGNFAGRFRPSP